LFPRFKESKELNKLNDENILGCGFNNLFNYDGAERKEVKMYLLILLDHKHLMG